MRVIVAVPAGVAGVPVTVIVDVALPPVCVNDAEVACVPVAACVPEVVDVAGTAVASMVGAFVPVGAVVGVKVGSGVLEGGSVSVGSAARVYAACVPAIAIVVACDWFGDTSGMFGMHALTAKARIKPRIIRCRRISTSRVFIGVWRSHP